METWYTAKAGGMTQADFSYFSDWSDAEQRIERAHDLYEAGRWNDALGELEAALAINPHNHNWLFNKGLTLDALERYEEAAEAYQGALALEAHDLETLNCLGIDYTRLGQHERALATFEQIEEADPTFEPAYCNRIITYAELGRHDEAEAMFYLARQIREECPLCYTNMGNSLFARKEYDRAVWCWRRARELDGAQPHLEYRMAQALWAKGDRQGARQEFLAALRRQPGDLEVLLEAGILLLEMNELEGAGEKFHRIVELEPRHAQAQHYLGEIALQQGRIAPAVECFHRAVEADGNLPGSRYRLGECYLLLGQQANAREALLEELRFTTAQGDLLADVGCLLLEAGERGEAMRCFERAIQTDPEEHLAYHNLSVCYYTAGLLEQGMDLSQKVLELAPTFVPALANLAYAHWRRREFGAARRYVGEALREAPGDEQLRRLRRRIATGGAVEQVVRPLRWLHRLAAARG